MTNTLFYGDNLEVLREHIADESVDLNYLDPPLQLEAGLQHSLQRSQRRSARFAD
jgi:site-specific DNA-methyltransferase (adenine-specific)